MKSSIATLSLFAALAAAAHAAPPADSRVDSLVESIVAQAAAQMRLAPPAERPPPVATIGPERRPFVQTMTGGTLAQALGMASTRLDANAHSTTFGKLVNLQGRRGRRVRRQRRELYRDALQELMAEHQRATLVPHETVLELSKLTGQRPERIRKDLFRVVLKSDETE